MGTASLKGGVDHRPMLARLRLALAVPTNQNASIFPVSVQVFLCIGMPQVQHFVGDSLLNLACL